MPLEGKCFMMMPITTPPELVKEYGDDENHFFHVMEELFEPAIRKIGLEPIRPITQGADLIHAKIIENIEKCEFVLCDMSIHNPNVFFELGIRTALNRVAAMVVDEKSGRIPFDNAPINCHKYSPDLQSWVVKEEIDKLAKHLNDSFKEPENKLWKFFGLTKEGTANPPSSMDEKLDFIIGELSNARIDPRIQGLGENQVNDLISCISLITKRIPSCELSYRKPSDDTSLYGVIRMENWSEDDPNLNSLSKEVATYCADKGFTFALVRRRPAY